VFVLDGVSAVLDADGWGDVCSCGAGDYSLDEGALADGLLAEDDDFEFVGGFGLFLHILLCRNRRIGCW
jgi:hypothetical protein